MKNAMFSPKAGNRYEAKEIPRFFQGEKWLVLTGLFGFLLAAVCGIWWLTGGAAVAPGGDISHAFSFDAALGLFVLSTAAIVPLSGAGPKVRAFFRWSYVPLALYSYAAETVQNARGVNPRFLEDGAAAFDVAVGNIFASVAALLILYYLFFAGYFFRPGAYRRQPELAIGIRYAMAAVVVSFAAGIWISMNQGRTVGTDGNLIWLHGLGFHALQALPAVAWLSARAARRGFASRGYIHAAGISFLLGLLAIGWQTYLGRALFVWSALPLAAAACFLISLAAGAVSFRLAFLEPGAGKGASASGDSAQLR
ncbi:hypothetical protein SAMN02799624_00786 [Paenibacillus sp. UNC496MF]|uniref:hypothetical protein n=1 Tax=Paenibacillus sp. UNC496MF TaxID=1502753 RepID=UPI0008E806D2|nr:hypothetical protein [Paenibacillus sp. UNC496MF]SFI39368.1 hypothetical protein SAMN02799624_00786 [Paenibacillus sp. UNC496MF]